MPRVPRGSARLIAGQVVGVAESDPIDALAVARAPLREPDLPPALLDDDARELRLSVDDIRERGRLPTGEDLTVVSHLHHHRTLTMQFTAHEAIRDVHFGVNRKPPRFGRSGERRPRFLHQINLLMGQ